MDKNDKLLEKLNVMLKWKRGVKFYAKRLGTDEETVKQLMRKLRGAPIKKVDNINRALTKDENLKAGTSEITFKSYKEIKTLDELIKKCEIDINVWEISRYVQNYWGNGDNPHWQVKAWLSKRTKEQEFSSNFIEFLENYIPISSQIPLPINHNFPASLIINKQDSHLDKYDSDGDNNINSRFDAIFDRINIIISQCILFNKLESITYILGSDMFNSEYMKTTTKGTPQTNILEFHEGFEKICQHEVDVINMLLENGSFVDVIYVPGNHDEYIGWHLMKWLEAYYRNNKRLSFDCSSKYRKYVSYGTTAMMFNHGDVIKPEKLAGIFPIEFKDNWSKHSNFYIFTGDKHQEVSKDFSGIKFYQIPAFSKAKSKWDDKSGYVVSKGEVTAFLIDKDNGMTNILKQYL
jgi:hypothetical protein